MYMSRIRLHPEAARHRDYWRTFRDIYQVHQEIWKVFSRGSHDVRRYLYRLDHEDQREPVILAVSEDVPIQHEQPMWRVETKEFRPQLHAGICLGFQLRANPTVNRDGKHHSVVMDEKWRLKREGTSARTTDIIQYAGERWLREQAERSGVRIEWVRVENYRKHEFQCRASKVQYATCDYHGMLTVQDPDALLHVLRRGLGRAKAFGCGMMMIRRVA